MNTRKMYELVEGSTGLDVKGHIFYSEGDFPEYGFEETTPEEVFRNLEWFVAERHCDRRFSGYPVNGIPGAKAPCIMGEPLDVIVAEPTILVAPLVAACARYGRPLTIWYKGEGAKDYIPLRYGFGTRKWMNAGIWEH